MVPLFHCKRKAGGAMLPLELEATPTWESVVLYVPASYPGWLHDLFLVVSVVAAVGAILAYCFYRNGKTGGVIAVCAAISLAFVAGLPQYYLYEKAKQSSAAKHKIRQELEAKYLVVDDRELDFIANCDEDKLGYADSFLISLKSPKKKAYRTQLNFRVTYVPELGECMVALNSIGDGRP